MGNVIIHNYTLSTGFLKFAKNKEWTPDGRKIETPWPALNRPGTRIRPLQGMAENLLNKSD
jgi:hypothetical protein